MIARRIALALVALITLTVAVQAVRADTSQSGIVEVWDTPCAEDELLEPSDYVADGLSIYRCLHIDHAPTDGMALLVSHRGATWRDTLREYRKLPKRLHGVRTRDVNGRRIRLSKRCAWRLDETTTIICPNGRVVQS